MTDREYDERIAHSLLGKVIDEFLTKYNRPAFINASANSLSLPTLKSDVEKYQDPRQADNIFKIQAELDETKIEIRKTIEAVLERGQKIDDMVAKSENLSASSKMFYTQVCIIPSSAQSCGCTDIIDARQRNRTPAALSCEYGFKATLLFCR